MGPQEVAEGIPLLRSNHVVLEDIPAFAVKVWQGETVEVFKCLPVPRRDPLSTIDPLGEMRKLDVEEGGLQVVEQAGESMPVVLAGLSIFSVESHAAREGRHLWIVGRNGAAITIAAKNLERIETPAAG